MTRHGQGTDHGSIRVDQDVAAALQDGRPVVALESAVITAGLPRQPLENSPTWLGPEWDDAAPLNLELARLMEREVRDGGATPATIAVIDGTLHIGLDDDLLIRLACDETAGKSAVGDLPVNMVGGVTAGTTVSATLAACTRAGPAPIRVFATGGIGGVHLDWTDVPDVSADLRMIAESPVCVVCAGAKSVLDVPATLEMLESLGVPVIGYRTNRFPLFYVSGDDHLRAPTRLDHVPDVAAACRAHWSTLGRPGGVLLANPVPDAQALDKAEVDQFVNLAESLATARGIAGRDRTPFLLKELAERTGGRALEANLALLAANAALAAQVAVGLGRE